MMSFINVLISLSGSIVNDDDDGLPNEYDYNDSFIDDEDLTDSQRSGSHRRHRSLNNV